MFVVRGENVFSIECVLGDCDAVSGDSSNPATSDPRTPAFPASEFGLRSPPPVCVCVCDIDICIYTYICICIYIYRSTHTQTHNHSHTQRLTHTHLEAWLAGVCVWLLLCVWWVWWVGVSKCVFKKSIKKASRIERPFSCQALRR